MKEALSFGASTKVVLVATSNATVETEKLPPLKQVVENVERLSRTLADPDVVGLTTEDIIQVVDYEHASEIADIIARAGKSAKDTFVVYYAGHGLRGDEKEDLYLCSTSTTDKNRKYNGLPISAVRAAIVDSPAQNRILILDCCFAGAGLPGAMSLDDVSTTVEHNLDIQGTYGVAAVPANRKAQAPPDELVTAFTGEIIDVLENGIKDKPKVLSIGDIFSQVRQNFHERAKEVPLPYSLGDTEKFRFARNRFFAHDDLALVKDSVEGLRNTVASYGLKVQSLEARIDELEAPVQPDPGPWSERDASESGDWEDFDLTATQWRELPLFIIDELLQSRAAARTSAIFGMGQLYVFLLLSGYFGYLLSLGLPVTGFLVAPRVFDVSSGLRLLQPLVVLVVIVEVLIVWAFLIGQTRKSLFFRTMTFEPDIKIRMSENEEHYEWSTRIPKVRRALNARYITLFGIKLQGRWATAGVFFAAVILGFLVINRLQS